MKLLVMWELELSQMRQETFRAVLRMPEYARQRREQQKFLALATLCCTRPQLGRMLGASTTTSKNGGPG